MKSFLRILLLGVVVILGFTVVFPEWFDLKDQVIAEKRQEQAEEEYAQSRESARQRQQETEARLRTLEPEAAVFSERIWSQVEAGNYQAPFALTTERLRSQLSEADAARVREIYEALGDKLSDGEAASRPGFDRHAPRAYLMSGMRTLMAESFRWSENALLKRTLELKLEQDQLKVDALLLEVFLYPDRETAVPEQIRRAHVFR